MQRGFPLYLALIVAASGLLMAQSPTGVVINEVFTGSPDWIEIRNFSGASRDISGWTVETSFSYTAYPTFTFPAGTTISPGESILVLENSNPNPFFGNGPPLGTQVFNTHFGYGWIGTSSGGVALADSNYVLQDYVGFGITGHLVPPSAQNSVFTNPVNRLGNNPSTGNALFRANMTDTDDGADWSQGLNGSETPGTTNPGQDPGPQAIRSLMLSPNSGVVSIDPNTKVATVTANIAGLVLEDGRETTDAGWDAIIGGSITLTGTAITQVNADYANLILTPTTAIVTTANSEVLTLKGIFAAESASAHMLSGPLGCTPSLTRSLSTRTLIQNQLSGTTSSALNQIHQIAQHSKIHFSVRFENGGARLYRLGFEEPSTGALTSNLANAGSGRLRIGVIGATQFEIYNVFVINPAYGLGLGSVYGIEWGTWQWQQVFTPLGTEPFHVLTQPGGIWSFLSPPGVVPPGIWLDHVTIEVVNGTPIFSEPSRAFF